MAYPFEPQIGYPSPGSTHARPPPSSRDFLGSDPNSLADPLDHSFQGDPMPSTVRLSIPGLDLTSDAFDKIRIGRNFSLEGGYAMLLR